MVRGAFITLILGTLLLTGCGTDDPYLAPPVFQRAVSFTETGGHLQPARLEVKGDTLFVAYNGVSRLDYFDLDLERLGTIELEAPSRIVPTGFAVTDTSVVVVDHALGVMAFFDRNGRYLDSFSTLPDGETKLAPLGLTAFSGTAYVADVVQKRVLAISINEAPNITERGELILSIPGMDAGSLSFPSAVRVTHDGRLFVGDAGSAMVRVFTCDGQPIYDFDPVPETPNMAPQAIAMDGLPDPGMQDENSFDPSGIRAQGRYHVADGLNGRIHMFNPVGAYLGSYPEDPPLAKPSGLAIHRASGLVFIAEPSQGRILVYQVNGE
jgi:hypothetical protein